MCGGAKGLEHLHGGHSGNSVLLDQANDGNPIEEEQMIATLVTPR